MHLKFSTSSEIKNSACTQPDQALHQTSENKGVYSCQRPCILATPSQTLCFPCTMSTACSSGLDKAPASTCCNQLSWGRGILATFPATDSAAVVFWQQGSGRKECSCKWCIVLLRSCCIIFASQGRNIPGNPSVFSGWSIKSPSSSASFLTVYFACLVQGTNCFYLSALLPLPPTPLESPILPGKQQPPPGRQSCLAAVLLPRTVLL